MEHPTHTELALTDWVLAGNLTDIPAKRSNQVRVFLTSTTTDVQAERHWIMKTAVPELRGFCRERGLDFQIVDMRWEMKDEVIHDPQTLRLCLQEIQNCRDVSIGPNFVALLGDKYGYRPLVSEIEASEFKLIKNCAVDSGYDVTLLTTWYLCDYNREPTMYVLQPISSLFPGHFENSPIQQQVQREWTIGVDKLHQLFRTATESLFKQKKISEEVKHKYYQSATEAEVTLGILLAGDRKSKTLCFQRTLNGITPSDGIRIVGRFTDLVEKRLDYEAEMLREQLRLEKVRFGIPRGNLYRYNLQWDKHGLDVSGNAQHKSYLEKFGDDFLSSVKEIVLSSIEELSAIYGNSQLLEEVLCHLHICKSKCSEFCGRELELLDIRDKMKLTVSEKGLAETQQILMSGVLCGGDNHNTGLYDNILDEEISTELNVNKLDEDITTELNDNKLDEEISTELSDSILLGGEGIINNDDPLDKMPDMKKTTHVSFACKEKSDLAKGEVITIFGDDVNDKEGDEVADMNEELCRITKAENYTTPLVIYGRSGSGKTSITAKVMDLSKDWFPGSMRVVRFLGMSSMTQSIREVLISLCVQISHLYNIPRPVGLDLVDFHFLVNYLKALLWRLDTSSNSLVVILDSVDKLSTADHAHTFNWLPTKLPPDVHLVISVVSDRLDCLKCLKIAFPEHDRYVEVTRLEKSTGLDIVNTVCARLGCHLAKKQSNLLLDKFEQSGGLPLFLKVLTDRAVSWRSFDNIQMPGSNIADVMNQVFDKLEETHSQVLVKHMMAYQCASRNGLTEVEMEDILSLDNEVLQDVYIHHLPMDSEVIRLQTLLWKQIQYAVYEFLMEVKCGGHSVTTWAHRLFQETATSRYLTQANVKQVHQLMAEYFQGIWSSKPKALHLSKGKNGLFPYAHRQVPTQPIKYTENTYNTRMLNCLAYHLIFSERFETLSNTVFTEPDWLYARCLTFSLTDLLEDFRLAETQLAAYIERLRQAVKKAEAMMPGLRQKQEVTNSRSALEKNLELFEVMKMVTRMVLMGSEQIRRDPAFLPLQIISQLGPDYKGLSGLETLVERCVDWCTNSQVPLLVPLTDCLPKPGGNLLFTISVDMWAETDKRIQDSGYQCLFLQEDTRRLYVTQQQCGKTDQICTYDLMDHGSCIRVVDVGKCIRSMKFTGNNKFLLMEEYATCHQSNTTSDFHLYKGLSSDLMTSLISHGAMTVSQSGKYVAYTAGYTVKGSRPVGLCVLKNPGRHLSCNYRIVYNTVYVSVCKTEMPVCFKIEDHEKPVTFMFISPDNTLLLTTERDDPGHMTGGSPPTTSDVPPKSLIFDLVAKKLLHELEPIMKITHNSVITKNNILICTSTTEKGMLYCYDMVEGKLLKSVMINEEFEPSILYVHASQHYVLCGYKGKGGWDRETVGLEKETVVGEKGKMGGESDQGDRIKVTQVLRIVDGTLHGEGPVRGGCAVLKVFGTNFIYYTTCMASDQTVSIYYAGHIKAPLKTATLIHRLGGHSAPITEILVPAKLDMVITASLDNTIKVWDLQTILDSFHLELTAIEKRLSNVSRLEPSPEQVTSQFKYTDTAKTTHTTQLCLNKYGDSLYVGTNDGKLMRYSTETGQLKVTSDINIDAISFMVLSQTGQYIIAIGALIHVEDLQSYKQMKLDLPAKVSSVAEVNNVLVCGFTHPQSWARLWNIQTGQVLKDLNGPYSFQHVTINKTGSKIVAAVNAWPVVIPIESAESKQPNVKEGHKVKVTCCCSNSLMAATGSDDGCTRVTNMKGDHLYVFKQRSPVAALTFTPDKRSLLSSGYRSIYVWSVEDGSLRYKVTRHQDIVTHLKFDKTGHFLVSFSNDKRLVLWDFTRGVSIAAFHTQTKISGLEVGDRAGVIAYVPGGLMDVCILKPNESLRTTMEGNYKPLPIQPKARALAQAFSSRGLARSSTCSVM